MAREIENTAIPKSRAMHVFHGNRLWVDPSWQEQLSAIGIDHDKDWTRLTSEDPVSASYTTTSNYRFTLSSGEVVYFKRYIYRRFKFKYWLQPSKAAVEAAGYHDLKNLGINTIQTLAYGEKRRFGLLRATFIITLGIPDTIELDKYLAQKWCNYNYTRKQKILNTIQPLLIKQLQKAHSAGFFHWDLKLRNILLQERHNTMNLFWIDCPRSRIKKPHHLASIVEDIYCLSRVGIRVLTPGQRMRFLLDYCNDVSLARKIYRETANKLKKNPPRPYWQLLDSGHPWKVANRYRIGEFTLENDR